MTLSEYNLYLDSCATYNYTFIKIFLDCIGAAHEIMHWHYNAGTTITNQEGWYGGWKIYLNEQGIGNLMSIPWLEREGYRTVYDTLKEWLVYDPDGIEIKFQRDLGLYDRMPYPNI